ncbi:hypothetical protein Zmor_026557 [Zophobas morio]|uniref:Uncharacterized protein n=1 Tax=Zophobas morio TaxID=2755281 RepID=A0AA38HU03_9CUCU|nr:hypothetical protein Zmor_026557 [Zophobas morio]
MTTRRWPKYGFREYSLTSHTITVTSLRGDPLHALPQQQRVTLQFEVNELPTPTDPSSIDGTIDPKGHSPRDTVMHPMHKNSERRLKQTPILISFSIAGTFTHPHTNSGVRVAFSHQNHTRHATADSPPNHTNLSLHK